MPVGAAVIDQLRVEVRTDLAKFKTELRAVKASVKQASTEASRGFTEVRRSVDDASGALKSMRGLLVGVAASIGVNAVLGLGRQALELADGLDKVSQRLGVNVEALQELRFAAQQSGVEQSTLDKALQGLSRRSAEAARGIGEAKDVLQELNIRLESSPGRLRPVEAILNDVADAFQRIEDPAERVRVATKLFEAEGVGLVSVLKDGSAGLRELREEARSTGQVLDAEAVKKLADLEDKVSAASTAIRNDLAKAFVEIAPVIEFFTRQTLAAVRATKEMAAAAKDFVLGDLANTPLAEQSTGDLQRQLRALESEREGLKAQQRDSRLGGRGPSFTAFGQVFGQVGSSEAAQLRDRLREIADAEREINEILKERPSIPGANPRRGGSSVGAGPLSKEELDERQRRADALREIVNRNIEDGKKRREEEAQDARDAKDREIDFIIAADKKAAEQSKERYEKEIEAAAELARERAEQVAAFSDRVAGRIVEGGEISFRALAESFEREFVQRALSSLINSGLTNIGDLIGGAAKGDGAGSALAGGLLKGAGLFAGFFARGGKIPAGQFGIAGENGPEVVEGPATVTPGRGGSSILVQVFNSSPERVEVAQAGRQGGREVVRVMVGEMNQALARGSFDGALRARFRLQPRTS
jgi:hypothetical protein